MKILNNEDLEKSILAFSDSPAAANTIYKKSKIENKVNKSLIMHVYNNIYGKIQLIPFPYLKQLIHSNFYKNE